MASKYKYLGIILDEHLTYNECTTTIADSAGRALGNDTFLNGTEVNILQAKSKLNMIMHHT